MLTMVWHWFTGWLISWGGVGGAIAVGAWALWFFCPAGLLTYKTQLMYIAIAATVIAITNTHSYTTGYNRGRSEVLHAVAAQDAKAKEEGDRANDDVQKCFAGGGSWNIADSVCDAAASNR
jgi:hypothetical protein